MSKLSEHPVTVSVGIVAGLIAILYTLFVFFTGRQGWAEESKIEERVTKPDSQHVFVDTTQHIQTITPQLIPTDTTKAKDQSTPTTALKTENIQKSKTKTFEIENKTYWSITMPRSYFIKFYDKDNNRYKFIAYIEAENYFGIATKDGLEIKLEGKSGNGEVSLSNNGIYLTGFLANHTMNHQLRENDNTQ